MIDHPTASLVIIGAEVLSAKIEDANGPLLLRSMRELGVLVREVRVVSDVEAQIAGAVAELASANDYVVTTGGVGPTHDDVTIAGIAAALGVPVVHDQRIVERLRGWYGEALDAAHLKMAEVPEGAQLHFNDSLGFVPVIQARNVFVLPGVPNLVRRCALVLAELLRGQPFFSRALHLRAVETTIAARLAEVQARYPEVAIGSYPRFDTADYQVKVTIDGRDAARVEAACAELRQSFAPLLIAEPQP